MLVENINYTAISDFEKDAEKELERSGICSYRRMLYVFKVGYNPDENSEYGRYYSMLLHKFDVNKKKGNKPVAEPEKFKFPHADEAGEKYLIVNLFGKSYKNTFDGPWFFDDFDAVVSALKDAVVTLTESFLADVVLELDDFKSVLK